MSEHGGLLHNMSAPPRSLVKYAGLSGLLDSPTPGAAGVKNSVISGYRRHGRPVRFTLRENLQGATVLELLHALGDTTQDGTQSSVNRRLITLINRRAKTLPLPDGCAVIKSQEYHQVLWDDPLSALAILSKSTDNVWLRSKSPSIHLALQRSSISLLIPLAFVGLLLEQHP